MATVTYRGPRPEIVPAFALPRGFLNDSLAWVGALRKNGKPKMVVYEAPVLERDRPTEVPGAYAFGLALIRRRPSPWFEVRFHRGEWVEVAYQMSLPARYYFCPHEDSFWESDDEPWTCRVCHGCGAYRSLDTRAHALAVLRWTPAQIADNLAGESKPLYVNGELAYSPPGWAPERQWTKRRTGDAAEKQGAVPFHAGVRPFAVPHGRQVPVADGDQGVRREAPEDPRSARAREEKVNAEVRRLLQAIEWNGCGCSQKEEGACPSCGGREPLNDRDRQLPDYYGHKPACKLQLLMTHEP